jgi:hypothetical protein
VSVLVLATGNCHMAIIRLGRVYENATDEQKADAMNMLERFTDDLTLLCDEIQQNTPIPK